MILECRLIYQCTIIVISNTSSGVSCYTWRRSASSTGYSSDNLVNTIKYFICILIYSRCKEGCSWYWAGRSKSVWRNLYKSHIKSFIHNDAHSRMSYHCYVVLWYIIALLLTTPCSVLSSEITRSPDGKLFQKGCMCTDFMAAALTRWGWNNMATTCQTIYSNKASSLKIGVFGLKILHKIVRKGPVYNLYILHTGTLL